MQKITIIECMTLLPGDPVSRLPLDGRAANTIASLGISTIGQFALMDLGKLLFASDAGKSTRLFIATTQDAVKRRLASEELPAVYAEDPIERFLLTTKQSRFLSRIGVNTVRDLLRADIETATKHAKGFGNITINQLCDIQRIISAIIKKEAMPEAEKWEAAPYSETALMRYPLYSGSADQRLTVSELHSSYHPECPVDVLELNVRSINALDELGVKTMKQALLGIPSEWMKHKNFGKNSLDNIRTTVREYLDSGGDIHKDFKLDLSSFESMTSSVVYAIMGKGRNSQMVAAYLSPAIEVRPTLESMGQLFGLTRERVRQILSPAMEKISSEIRLYQPFWDSILEILDESEGFVSISHLSQHVSEHYHWCDPPSNVALREFLALMPGIVITNARHVCRSEYPCLNCDVLISFLKESLEHADKIPLSSLCLLVSDGCARGCPSQARGISPNLLAYLIGTNHDLSHSWSVQGEDVFSHDELRLENGSISAVAMIILKRAAMPMHFSSIHKQVQTLRPNEEVNEHAVTAPLAASDDAVLWGRGTFIHRTHIHAPAKLIATVEDWILHELAQDVPFISAEGAFVQFEDECREAGLPNVYCLHSCLKMNQNQSLVFPRAPRISRAEDGPATIPLTIALEEWTLAAERIVSHHELKELALDKMHMKDFQWTQARAQMSNVIRTKGGGFLHVQNFALDSEHVREMFRYALTLTDGKQQAMAPKMFQDKAIACRLAKIESPQMLYSVLSQLPHSHLAFPKYPRIIRQADESFLLTESMVSQVTTYIKEQSRPCSFAELDDHFVKERAFDRQRTLYVYYFTEDVVRYLQHALIHLDTIGWNKEKQRNLDDLALRVNSSDSKQGALISRISLILENHEDDLPILKGDVTWTKTLLVDLLSKSSVVSIIGNNKDVYVPQENGNNIKTIDDLLECILRSDYGGAANLGEFTKMLIQLGVIKKNLTPAMISGEKIEIRNQEVFLKGL